MPWSEHHNEDDISSMFPHQCYHWLLRSTISSDMMHHPLLHKVPGQHTSCVQLWIMGCHEQGKKCSAWHGMKERGGVTAL